MRAASCVNIETAEVESTRPARPPCLFGLAQPWFLYLLRFYRGQPELAVKRRQVMALCLCQQCRTVLWREGLPMGADRNAWDGNPTQEEIDYGHENST